MQSSGDSTATTTEAETTSPASNEWPVPLVRLRDTGTAPFDVIFDMETNDPDDYLTLYALHSFARCCTRCILLRSLSSSG
jgi:hypothetical protein